MIDKLLSRNLKRNLRFSFTLLSQQESRKLIWVSAAQFALAIVDLLGVTSLGLVGTLSVYGIQSKAPTGRLAEVLNFLGLDHQSLQMQVAVIGFGAALLLTFRTLFSLFITRKTMFFLSNRASEISSQLFAKLLRNKFFESRKQSNQELLFSLTTGVNQLITGVIGTGISLFSDAVLLLVLITGIFIIDPIMAMITMMFFGAVGMIMLLVVQKRIQSLARQETNLTISNNEAILESMRNFKEIFVKGRLDFYIEKIRTLRFMASRNTAELAFIPNLSKYVAEISLVLGGLLIAGVEFSFNDAAGAMTSISLFLAASGRIVPGILRIQNGLVSLRITLITSNLTIELAKNLLEHEPNNPFQELSVNSNNNRLILDLEFKGVTYKYPNSQSTVIKDLNFYLKSGSHLAILGPSGVGKTTVVDLLLGILSPLEGSILIGGKSPLEIIHNFPGSLAYVPQDVSLIDGSIADNVALGFPESEKDMDLVIDCLDRAHLSDLLLQYPEGVKKKIGEKGVNLSGGQRQRIGIARALYTHPKLLVLDEATSSLDSLSEQSIKEVLEDLHGDVSVISIAHRLSTIENADQVLYLKQTGDFEYGTVQDVRKKIPNFDRELQKYDIH